jgi:hypothetical protein
LELSVILFITYMKKVILAVVLGLCFAAGTAFAEIVSPVRAGSSKARVGEVQAALNACANGVDLVVDGLWGPRTLAAVRKYQLQEGFQPATQVGPLTASALNDCWEELHSNPTPTPPVTTSPLCPNGMTLVSNCILSPNVGTTVTLCPNGMTLASNCTISPTTGGGSTVITGPEGNLTNITKLGSYNNTKVSEGGNDVKVYGIEVTARDGDQRIDGLNIAFKNTGTGSTRFTKYASDVSVWLDGVEIGRKLTSQYSDDSGDTYTYRFSGMNGVVKMNQKSQLVVAVTGVGSMDSIDANNEVWMVEAGSVVAGSSVNYISAASANGRYRDFGNDLAGSTIDFQKAGGLSSDQRFRVVTASSNPSSQVTQVSQTADTNDVLLLAMDIKAENTGMILQKLPITLGAVDGTSDGVTPFTNALVRSLKLYANGVKIADESVPQDGADSATETIIFGSSSKLGYRIASNSTVKFEVRADLNDTENTGVSASDFDNGDKIAASFTPANLANAVVELDNANQDTVSNRSGSATGENQTLRSTGLQISLGVVATEANSNQNGEVLTRTVKIPVALKAFDETMYISQAALYTLTADSGNGLGTVTECTAGATPYTWCSGSGTGTPPTAAISFSVEEADGTLIDAPITNSTTWTSSDAPVEGIAYRIDSGTTRNFMLTVVLSGGAGDSQNQFRVQLDEVNAYNNSAFGAGQVVQDLTPTNSYETGYYTLNEDDL